MSGSNARASSIARRIDPKMRNMLLSMLSEARTTAVLYLLGGRDQAMPAGPIAGAIGKDGRFGKPDLLDGTPTLSWHITASDIQSKTTIEIKHNPGVSCTAFHSIGVFSRTQYTVHSYHRRNQLTLNARAPRLFAPFFFLFPLSNATALA